MRRVGIEANLVGMDHGPRENVRSRGQPWKHRLHWLFLRRPCFGGLVGALVAFCVSLTPSLLPRTAILQGVVCGVSAIVGYGLGSATSALVRRLPLQERSRTAKRVAWWCLIGATFVTVPTFLVLGRQWQETIRRAMGMTPQPAWQLATIVVVAVFAAAVVLLVSRLVRGLTRVVIRLIDRWAPRWLSISTGLVVTTVLLAGLIQGFVLNPTVAALNSTFSVVNDGTSDEAQRPITGARSGSPESLIPWDTLGVKGRDFIGTGPDVADISGFSGRPAVEPVRVYVGLRSAATIEERVELVMDELDRTDAWEREIIAVFTSTGTGWVDPKSVDALEYIHNGDTASMSVQYSFLPSWISFLVDQDKAAEAGRSLIGAVRDRLAELPPDERPQLLVFGESLGSFGTESAFADVDEFVAGVDGALLVGPVFRNDIHGALTDGRDAGSPAWRPVYSAGETVRFAVEPDDLAMPETAWARPRLVYLQNASDPITYWHPNLLLEKPDWLEGQRGHDVSDDIVYVPIVTFLQTAADLAFAAGVPAGHGHKYGANPVDAWVAICEPAGWTDENTQRLRAIIGHD